MAKKVPSEARRKSKKIRSVSKRGKRASRFTCASRFLKNVRYIQRVSPEMFSREDPIISITKKIRPEIIERIHKIENISKEIRDPTLASALKKNKVLNIFRPDYLPLFNGTFQFVQITFSSPPLIWTSRVSTADIQTAISYLQAAIKPILLYISSYRATRVNIANNIIPYSPQNGTGLSYSFENVEQWVNEIVQVNNLSRNTCIVILAPKGRFSNTYADSRGAFGYHGKANVPYTFSYVYGQNLTVADKQNYYAFMLSHEIEEAIVDPNVDFVNPEVADPCTGNCNNTWINFFDNNDNYLLSSRNIPTGLAYSYHMNAIATPPWSTILCPMGTPTSPIPDSACAYPPPTLEEACDGRRETIELLRQEIRDLDEEIARETNDNIRRMLIQQKRDKQAAVFYFRHEIEILGCNT